METFVVILSVMLVIAIYVMHRMFEAYRYEAGRAEKLTELITEFQDQFEIINKINHNLCDELKKETPKFKRFLVPKDVKQGTWITVDEAFEKVFIDED